MKSVKDKSILTENRLPIPQVRTAESTDLADIAEVNTDLNVEKLNTLQILSQTEIPIKDPIDLAERFGKVSDTSFLKSGNPEISKVGEMRKFWKLDVDTNKYKQTDARLEYVTPHLYFWIEEGVDFDRTELEKLAEEFETKIYPTNREIFGSESTPGVDGDKHLTVLFARGLGGVGGYFSSTDTLTQQVEPYSNEAEMFYLSADYTYLDDVFTYGVLAHEFQHMIHWNIDRNESAWVTEGLSELAVELNGYDTGGFTYLFAYNPDIQLNFWPGNDQGDSAPHYGAAYLFMRYLYQRFGESAIQALVSSPFNGFDSIDMVFKDLNNDSKQPLSSEQIFQDWSIANYINGTSSDPKIFDKYGGMPFFPSFAPTETLSCENSEWQDRTVNQFGSDYIEIDCTGAYQVEITGEQSVKILPIDPHSGEIYYWSNYGDESDMTLSQTFDFSAITSPLTLSFWTWYDLEKDYDYLYLTASTDNKNWEILKIPYCTEEDPTGANYGCGLNGKSNGWIKEEVDLSVYAGKKVNLRFEYITDMAVNGDGFAVDDISIDAINYFSDFEKDQGGWLGNGFVRIKNSLPQSFGIALLENGSVKPNEKTISLIGLNYSEKKEDMQTQIKPIIVINGLTRYTYQPAGYRIKISKNN
jgi:immune inhibitor A